jgi:hypothetical protein
MIVVLMPVSDHSEREGYINNFENDLQVVAEDMGSEDNNTIFASG